MRIVGLVVLCASIASAQTRAEGTFTAGAGASVQFPGDTLEAQTAFDVLLERGFSSSLTVSARLVALVFGNAAGAFGFQDLSSSVRVQFRRPSWDSTAVYLELYPFDSRRVRSTFDFANYWGKPLRPRGVAPLLTAGVVHRNFSIWVAARTYQQYDDQTFEPLLRWTGMLGAGVALSSHLNAEMILTASDRGDVPGLANQGIPTSVIAAGGSARISWQTGGGVNAVRDPASLADDPDRFARLLTGDHYETSRAAWVGLEGGVASQNLEDPEVFGKTRRELTGYVDFQARFRVESLRLFASVRLKPPQFIRFDSPGASPYKGFPAGTVTQDEVAGLFGIDRRFARSGLVTGLVLRLSRPANFKSPSFSPGGNEPLALAMGKVVVLSDNGFAILPAGEQAQPRFQATASLLFNRFEPLSALLQAGYDLDPNFAYFLDANAAPRRVLHHGGFVSLFIQLTF